MKEKPSTKALLIRSLLGKGACLSIILLTTFCYNSRVFGQWQKILSFQGGGFSIRDIVYFLDDVGHPEIGFASFSTGTLRTSDGGNTWQQITSVGPLVDMTFKDAVTGWTAGGLMTEDGGLTWSNMILPIGGGSGIHYDPYTNRLFYSLWTPAGYVSTDEGKTWRLFTQDAPLNGYAFVDQKHGIIGTTESSQGPTDGVMRTSDGGLIWTYDPSPKGCWQPYARKGTSTFFYVSEYDNNVRRSDDYGVTWSIVGNLPQYQTGCLKGDLCGNLYTQGSTAFGNFWQMSTSSDNGVTWNSIAGPAIYTDTRFYIVGSKVFAEDDDGSVWMYNGPVDGPTGTSLIGLPSVISVSSSDCDTQFVAIPFQTLSCYSGNDSLIVASLISSGSSFQLQGGSIPRQYVSQDSVHVAYSPNQSGQDTATLFLSVIAGGIRIDTNIQIIGNAVRPSKSVALSDSSLSFSSFNCQEADTTIYLETSGCPNDFDSITGIFLTGSNEFTILPLDTLARKFNLKDSLHIQYSPTASENNTALIHLQLLIAGQVVDKVISISGSSTSPQIILTPALAGSGNATIVGVTPGQDVPFALTLTSNVANLMGLDSIVFEVDFDSDMLSFDSAILAPGWTISSTELRQGQWIYTLVNDTATIPQEMTLALLHFTAYLTKDTISLVSLASFNGFLDPNKHVGCDELSIANGNSIAITAEDSCGDILLRNFMITGSPGFQIVSIQPNPAFDFLTVDCESPSSTEVDAIIYNNLGTECLKTQNNVQGRTTLNVPLDALIPGVYHLLLRSSFGSTSTNFVKF